MKLYDYMKLFFLVHGNAFNSLVQLTALAPLSRSTRCVTSLSCSTHRASSIAAMHTRQSRGPVPSIDSAIEVLWIIPRKKRKTSHPADSPTGTTPASGSAAVDTEHWWGADVKTMVISVESDSGYLAECSIVYEAYGDDYVESSAIVRFLPRQKSGELILFHTDTETHHEWRYAQARSGPEPGWHPEAQSPPSTMHQPANLYAYLRRLTAMEEEVALHQPKIARLEETIAHLRLEMSAQNADRVSTNPLDTLLGLMRYKLVMQSRKVPKKPLKCERVINAGDNAAKENGGSTTPSNPASECVGDLARTSMVLEFDCTSVLFAAFARKLHTQFTTAQVCAQNGIVFWPSFRATQDHASNVPGFRIFVPSIVHIAAAANIGKETDLRQLFFAETTRKVKTMEPSTDPSAEKDTVVFRTIEVVDLRISGSYAFERGDSTRSCDFLVGASFPSRINRCSLTSPASRGLLSLNRASRRMDFTTNTPNDKMTVRVVDRPIDMFCEEDNNNPLRLDRFYFQWKPLAPIPSGYSKDIGDSVNIHGKLTVNCPYVHVFGEHEVNDIKNALTAATLDEIIRLFRAK